MGTSGRGSAERGSQVALALQALGALRSYPKNTVLVQEGDTSDQLYLIVEGRLKVFLADADGKEIIVDLLGPGRYFGEMALDGQPRSASVMTLEPAQLVVVQAETFKRHLREDPQTGFELILDLIGRSRHLTRSVGDLALLDVYGRVARYLLENSVEVDGMRVVRKPGSQQEIAKRVGTSREMVSRIFGELRAGGYIADEKHALVIRQRLPKRW